MPNFAPNQGFKMPGVGSKNIDSPGNFRDEQHVDKVGYCDTTEDRMLPEGSSPLKARYTTTGYRKDIKELDVPQGRVSPEDDVYEKTQTITEGADKNNTPSNLNESYDEETTSPTSVTKLGSNQGNTGVGYKKSFDALSADQKEEYGDLKGWTTYVQDYWAKENAKTTETPGQSRHRINTNKDGVETKGEWIDGKYVQK